MAGEFIYIIADERDHGFYRTISFGDNTVEVHLLRNLINCIRDCQAGIILLDCNYELEVGLSSLRCIKAVLPTVPVVLLADVSLEDLILKAFKAGARDFFKKPVNVYELQETVKGLLSMKKKAREMRSPFVKKGVVDSRKFPKKFFGKEAHMQSVHLYNAIRFIQKNLPNVISIDRVAKEANTSRYHFWRLFKKRVGISPIRFVAYLRIEEAKKLLGRRDLIISAVAADVGFNDSSNFIKQFKKLTGMTPASYRKSIM